MILEYRINREVEGQSWDSVLVRMRVWDRMVVKLGKGIVGGGIEMRKGKGIIAI